MTLNTDIHSHSNGAQFVRGDLHIHSYGPPGPPGSHDVRDTGMTPQAIVDACVTENLGVIAITDHNVVGNVRAAVDYARDKPILVLPGVELSTPQGHLLVYCPTPEKLEGFYGKLNIADDKKSCHDTMAQCLKHAKDYDGFGILAHIDREAGLEWASPKFDTFKQDILNQNNLLGIEITRPESKHWYSGQDDNADRKHFAKERQKTLGHEPDVYLAVVMGSDSHTVSDLGRNMAGAKRLTRFKMESPTFDSLRIALVDSSARVRLEDVVPSGVPHFVGIKIEGGFLKDQIVHFSPNLTCIIGGRGAGKSLMLESLLAVSGNASQNSIIDSEVWPDCISLIYEDVVGQQHVLTRSKASNVLNTDPNGPSWISIESYGQGQTAETIQHCDKDPAILLEFLDRFINLDQMGAKDEELRNSLSENQTEIERLQFDINRIDEVDKAKKLADSQVETLKKQKAGEVVELEQKLANERAFRTKLQMNLNELLTSIDEGLTSDELTTLMGEMDGSTLAVGKAEFEAVKALVTELASEVDELSNQLKEKITAATDKITAQLTKWTAKENTTRENIEEIRRELEKQKIKLDMAFIRKVTKDATDYALMLERLKKSIPKQKEAFAQRQRLINERRSLKSKMFTTRGAFATVMNKHLAACVVDYEVHFRYREGVLSAEFEEIVKNAMGWRTAQVPKATILASNLSPIGLLDAIIKNQTGALEQIVDGIGNRVFSKNEAQQILDTLRTWQNKCAIERCRFQDRPELKVTTVMKMADGRARVVSREFGKLSLGQQQSILLTILLFSKTRTPLVIDQPEDNLDSEFIYKTVVRSLRSIKEGRQIIIVTHNPNIAVLGDSELIIPLRAGSELSVVRNRGSIDTAETKDIVCTILEGSREAFKRRGELYGYSNG